MTLPISRLRSEQDELRNLFAAFREDCAPADKRLHARRICRQATAISQVRDEVVYPWCASRLDPNLLDDSMIQMDLARVIIRELVDTPPDALWHDGLVRALGRLLQRHFECEEAEGGLWSGLPPEAAEVLDARFAHRFDDVYRCGRDDQWRPLEPAGLETLRNSVPEGAVAWSPT